MSRKKLMQEMDAPEVMRWMAYEKSIDPESYDKLIRQVHLERSAEQTPEERSQAMINMFKSLVKPK